MEKKFVTKVLYMYDDETEETVYEESWEEFCEQAKECGIDDPEAAYNEYIRDWVYEGEEYYDYDEDGEEYNGGPIEIILCEDDSCDIKF